MRKKIIISLFIVALLAVAGGAFLWWQDQADARALNKTLPQGVRVVKSPWGGEYKVVNKVDGYEFNVPKAWKGIEKIEYVPEQEIMGLKSTGIGIEGKVGGGTLFSLDIFYLSQDDKANLLEKSQKLWNSSGLIGDLTEGTIGNFKIVKGTENIHLGGTYIYFLENNKKMYAFNNGSEDFIKEIVLSGKW